MPIFLIKQAAGLLGVSDDTLRRWADRGRVETTNDHLGRLAVDGAALAALAEQLAETADREPGGPVVAQSVRNRFTGLDFHLRHHRVPRDPGHQAGPHRFVSLVSREAADELGLQPGMLAVAAVKATNVTVEIPASRSVKHGPV